MDLKISIHYSTQTPKNIHSSEMAMKASLEKKRNLNKFRKIEIGP